MDMDATAIPTPIIAQIYPQRWRTNVSSNWPVVAIFLKSQGIDRDRKLVLYLLATIGVESRYFTPDPEHENRFSKQSDKVTYASIRSTDSATISRPFGAYDSTFSVDKKGRFHINKDLGNRVHRGLDDALMRSRHGDEPLPDSDDGFRYRGRGFIQLTGRYNYKVVQETIGRLVKVDILNDPESLSNPETAAAVAAAWIRIKADKIRPHLSGNLLAARKVINPGGLALQEFTALYRRADSVLLQAQPWFGWRATPMIPPAEPNNT